ncbi:YitT family protein [Bacillaceae bacterium]
MKIKLKNLFAILAGSAIMGFGINYFNLANGLAEGGITGVTILLKYTLDLNPGLMTFVLNLPLFFLGWKVLGRSSFLYTLVGTTGLSFFLWLFGDLRLPLRDPLLASLYAGVNLGVGLGLIFRYGGTTGGVDIIARLMQKYYGWSIGRTMFSFDFFVLAASLYYLDYEKAMYTLVAVFIGAKVVDFVQQGAYAARAAVIISEHIPEIARKIMHEMSRGATIFQGKGAYTGKEKNILYCVIGRNELTRLKNLVHAIDPHAFVIVNDVHEVLGEGFTLDENKNPLE